MNNFKETIKDSTEELQSKFTKKMIHMLIKYRSPKLFPGCYVEIDLVQGKFFGDKTIGQLVGRSGERKEEFFRLTGIKPHIEDSKEHPLLILSKYNVREIKLAYLLGQRFKTSKSWSSGSIHKHFQQLSNQLIDEETELGSKELKQFEPSLFSNELMLAVGKMNNENYSEVQTLLEHSKEVANISRDAAKHLELDGDKSYKLAFFHDIGKVFLPYYLHNAEKVLEYLPYLHDAEIKDCIISHHNSFLSFETPYIALVSLLNKAVSQNHFLRNCIFSETVKKLRIKIQNSINELLERESRLHHFTCKSGPILWVVLNFSNNCSFSEEEWATFLNNLKECVSLQIKSDISKVTLSEEESRFNISIYTLPRENIKASITKLRFNLNSNNYPT